MAKTIEQRGRCSWRVSIPAGYDNNKQKLIRKTFRFPSTWSMERQRKEVEKQAALLYAECINGNQPPSRDMNFRDFAQLWLDEYAKVNMQPKTIHECKVKLDYRILPALGLMKLSEIKPLTVTRFMNQLASSKLAESQDRFLSSQTLAHYQRLLSSIFATAVRWELMSSNPCMKLRMPQVRTKPVNVLDEDSSVMLLAHLEAAPLKYRCIVLIGIMTGLRLGEIVALKWADFDMEHLLVHIERSRSYVPGKGNFDKCPKSQSSTRTIALPQAVVDHLGMLEHEQMLRAKRLGDRWHDLGYLFTTWDGRPMGHNTPSRWFNDFQTEIRSKQQAEQLKLGIDPKSIKLFPRIRFHDLRHTHATLLLSEGVDLETVRLRLGHSKASTTANIYCHPLPAKDQRAAGIIESLLVKPEKVGMELGLTDHP